MAAYVITWKPTRWPWNSFENDVARSQKGEAVSIKWSTGNRKSIEIGDRIFLLRQHKDRGLIGSGTAMSGWYEDAHWSDADKTANYVDVDFDGLVKTELPVEKLDEQTDFQWNNVQASGYSLSESDALEVEQMWAAHCKRRKKTVALGRAKSVALEVRVDCSG